MTTSTKLTFTEHIELLTGYDEQAIVERFGADIDELRPTMKGRALIFVSGVRNGAKAEDAYKTAMSLTLRQAGDFFADDEGEALPDEGDDFLPTEPVTESGKDAAGRGETPSTSPAGA